MDKDTEKVYSAFGYDISNGLRKLNQITDEEALTIGDIFNNQYEWRVDSRNEGENGTIKLKSNPYPINVVYSGGRIDVSEREESIFLKANGKIRGPLFDDRGIHLVNQYLISIGVEREVLTPSKLEDITSGKLNTKELNKF